MRHRANRLRLNQKPDHARSVQRNLVTSLLLYEQIRTTRKRAKVIQPLVDSIITIAKTKEPRIAIRAIALKVSDSNASRKVMEVLKPRYAKRHSGYTSITAVGSRKGDGAELVDMVLMDREVATSTESKVSKVSTKPKKAAKADSSSAK